MMTNRLSIHSLGIVAIALAHSSPMAAAPAEPDSAMVMRGGESGTVFEDLTIEGEDRIRIEFERPDLNLDLNPKNISGLEWDPTHDIVNRNGLDFTEPLVQDSRLTRSPFLPRPWFHAFRTGAVVTFRPAVEGVESWKLQVADSRGRTVASFQGEGKVPKEITWNGLTTDGTPAPPGLTYSFVFEASDRAGNTRNFMGEAFELPSYRQADGRNMTLMFSGAEVVAVRPDGTPPAILLEAAGWLNQVEGIKNPIRITATARTYEQAQRLGEVILATLGPLTVGDPSRLTLHAQVAPDAPEVGTLKVEVTP